LNVHTAELMTADSEEEDTEWKETIIEPLNVGKVDWVLCRCPNINPLEELIGRRRPGVQRDVWRLEF